jgi:hypothetical protein
MRIPARPAYLREASQVRRERSLGLPLVRGDALDGLGDLALEIGERLLLRVARGSGHFANPEAGDFQYLQGIAVLLKLNPVPGDVAIAVSDHGCGHVQKCGPSR